MLTQTERSLRSRMGGFAVHAKYDSVEMTESARSAARTNLDRRLVHQYNLDPAAPDFAARLSRARSAYFAGLALKAATARRKARDRAARAKIAASLTEALDGLDEGGEA